eukprot:TRINITY_DN44618_c0_g1_i1.p1 TRINITY_DN44618_c0_g1~~TRINITY_DN44618_c0_g1_i1.p1  ORF type:complete len:258 (+),score=46.26 TRINITY_DN44618_c0_g1_i1:138-911(+)
MADGQGFKPSRLRREQQEPEKSEDSVMNCPVVSAAYYGSVEMLGAVLRSGGDVDELDRKENWRPLHAAVFTDSAEAVAYLLKHRANMDLTGPKGMTPLHLAVRDNSVETTELLLAARANPLLQDEDGRTVPELAVANNSNNSLRILDVFAAGGSSADSEAVRLEMEKKAEAQRAEEDRRNASQAATAQSCKLHSSMPLSRQVDVRLEAGSLEPAAQTPIVRSAAVGGGVTSYGSAVDPEHPNNNPELTIDDLEHMPY